MQVDNYAYESPEQLLMERSLLFSKEFHNALLSKLSKLEE